MLKEEQGFRIEGNLNNLRFYSVTLFSFCKLCFAAFNSVVVHEVRKQI